MNTTTEALRTASQYVEGLRIVYDKSFDARQHVIDEHGLASDEFQLANAHTADSYSRYRGAADLLNALTALKLI